MNHEYYEEVGSTNTLSKHLAKSFLWVFFGLLVTGVMALVTVSTDLIYVIYSSGFGYFGLVIAELALVMYLSRRIYTMSNTSAKLAFLGYSALTGMTISSVLVYYGIATVGIAFILTASMFGALAVIGLRTERDLTSFGNLLFAALIALIIATAVNLIFRLGTTTLFISYAGLAIFMGLTAYDAQKIKNIYYSFQHDEELLNNFAIYGALQLYLDFINIFLYVVRILGNGRRRN